MPLWGGRLGLCGTPPPIKYYAIALHYAV